MITRVARKYLSRRSTDEAKFGIYAFSIPTASGHSLPMHSAPAPNNVGYCLNSDHPVVDERGQRIASHYRDHMTRGKSGHRAAHWSLILPACFFGQSAVISASQSITLPYRVRCSISHGTESHALTTTDPGRYMPSLQYLQQGSRCCAVAWRS